MPDQSYQDVLHLLDAHLDMLNHTPVKHTRWHVSATTFLLQLVQAPQDKACTGGETVAPIRQSIMRITGRHGGSTLIKEDLHCVVFTHWITTTHGVRLLAMPKISSCP
jgi:hypothetical protein